MSKNAVNSEVFDILCGRKTKDLNRNLIGTILDRSQYNKVSIPITSHLRGRRDLSSKQIKKINQLSKIGNSNLRQQKRTLLGMEKSLGKRGIAYLVSRTKRTISYITYDVDIIVASRDFHKAVKSFEEGGYKTKKHGRINGIRKGWQVTAKKEKQLLVDIHKNVSWLGSVYLSEDDIWESTKKGKIVGVSCPMPNESVELVLVCANVLFEKFHLTILDYLYIKDLLKKANMKKVESIIEKHKWKKEFKMLIASINKLENNNDYRKINPYIFSLQGGTSFPLVISAKNMLIILLRRVLARRGISLVAICYIFFLYLKMYIKGDDFYPYYFSWT